MKLGSLFSGIGGFELAAEWCGHRTIWQSEIDPYCTALLAERFPGTPNLGNAIVPACALPIFQRIAELEAAR